MIGGDCETLCAAALNDHLSVMQRLVQEDSSEQQSKISTSTDTLLASQGTGRVLYVPANTICDGGAHVVCLLCARV
jgi:hypothetical protein